MNLKKIACLLALTFLILTPFSILASPDWSELFPLGLLDRNDNKVSTSVLNDKLVGLYFAADWCSSCQKFTPAMVQFRNANADQFEIVFVSSDKNKTAQFSYMAKHDMQWPTLEFRSKPANALRERFSVTSIPTLIVLSPQGELITLTGKADVASDPAGAMTKWKNATPSPLPYSTQNKTSLPVSGRLSFLNNQVIQEVSALESRPEQGWIKGKIGEKDYFVVLEDDKITGEAGGHPIAIEIDKQKMSIKGNAHNSTISLMIYLFPDEYRLEGDIYDIFFWNGIDWASGFAMGGISCTMLELNWSNETGALSGFLGDRKIELNLDKETGLLTGELFKRPVTLQLINADLNDFIMHLYLFLK